MAHCQTKSFNEHYFPYEIGYVIQKVCELHVASDLHVAIELHVACGVACDLWAACDM